jgi:hypothetical protein
MQRAMAQSRLLLITGQETQGCLSPNFKHLVNDFADGARKAATVPSRLGSDERPIKPFGPICQAVRRRWLDRLSIH